MSYLNVDEVATATQNLAADHPALCTLITLPHPTFEGRTCRAVRLGGGAPGTRDCAMIICGQHAREWGSCEIGLNFCVDLIEAYEGGTGLAYGGKSFTAGQVQSVLDTLHLVVLPLVNPDGRHHSQTSDSDWRRNRNPDQSGGDPDCVGVDLNRNYDFLFDLSKFAPAANIGSHTSTNPCNANQVYHGPSAFSEAETKNVRFLLDAHPRTRWFIDVHSYSELILWNWGDDQRQSDDPAMNFLNPAFDGTRGVEDDAAYREFIPSGDAEVSIALALRFRDALQAVRGKSYVAKSSYELYPTSGTSKDYAYSRHFVDPSKGKTYGYTVEWGTQFQPPWAEMELIIQDVTAGLIELCVAAPCGAGLIAVTLDTPTIEYNDVPEGVETVRAVVFSVETCAAVDFDVIDGPSPTSGPGTFGLPMGGAALPAAPSSVERQARIWVSHQGTDPGDVTEGEITIRCVQTGLDYVVPIFANTIAQPKVASVMVLDRSGSMDASSGIPAKTRLDVLHEAAPTFVGLLPDTSGIGVVSFDHDAVAAMPFEEAGAMGSGDGRDHAFTAIADHMTNPAGNTAIGDGVEAAHDMLGPVAGYDHKAIVVFTDGKETASKRIDEVAGLINERVFAIGLGTLHEVDPVALNALVNNTGGYLLMVDQLGPHDAFRLAKYFVQILAGVTNAEVIVDPDGIVLPGVEVRVPFDVTEADYGSDAILLSPAPWAVDFEIETPAGARFGEGLGGVTGAAYAEHRDLAFYRMGLPLLAGGAAAHRGRWHMVLKTDAERVKKYGSGRPQESTAAAAAKPRGIPYSAVVHARSNLRMAAYLTQSSQEPGGILRLRAVLSEIGLPVEGRAKMVAEVRRPDGSAVLLPLPETGPGEFEATTVAPLTGIYPVRFRARGHTLRGFPFTREALRTGIVWRGGDREPDVPKQPGADGRPDWCGILRCLIANDGIQQWLKERRIDPEQIRRCLYEGCRERE
ncbi:MAG: M14 family zinc carboxypeptidase [Allosphingosinicella sp.]